MEMDKPSDQFKPLQPIYSLASGTSTPPHQVEYAAERAKLLLGFYRKGDAEDPDTYVAGVAAVLSEYPADIIRRVTDPRTGIASRSKWLPALAEIRDFCENEFAPTRRMQEFEKRSAERRRALPPPDEDKSIRPTYDELKAKAGENWGLAFSTGDAKIKAALAEHLMDANRRIYIHECEAEGIDPSLGVSPSLLKSLGRVPAPAQTDQ